jgi:flavin-dependent dehydrogenase
MATVDVAIVGAGPAGSATALAVLRAGIPRVALIDRTPAGGRLGLGETAAPPVGPLLTRLGQQGILDHPQSPHRKYLGNLSAWGSETLACEDFLFRLSGHGWHLDRLAFDQDLRQTAVARGAQPLLTHSLRTLQRSSQGWDITLQDKTNNALSTLTARVVVDASGRRAVLGQHLGVQRQRLDRLVALAVTASPHDAAALSGRSFIESMEHGWWYAACLPNGQAMVTLMSDDDIIRDQGWHDKSQFLKSWAATHHLSTLVPPPDESCTISTVSAASQFSPHVIGAGWLAVGDALIGFDPLTSSGIAGALDDALAAADTITAWFGSSAQDAVKAAKAYSHRANSTLGRYLSEHRDHYRAEQRWSEHPFWKRRHIGLMPIV